MSLSPLPRFLLPSRARIRIVLMTVLLFVLLGTVTFHLLEGWSILDSLYVTAQTVTTVGFGDLTPRTAVGRLFAKPIHDGGRGHRALCFDQYSAVDCSL
jgi:voltage-gated potassium channel